MSQGKKYDPSASTATAESKTPFTFGRAASELVQTPVHMADKYFCLECRTLLYSNTVCDGGPKHRVVSVNQPEGAEQLRNEVWGPPSLRRRAREIMKAGGTGLAADSCLQGADCAGCEGIGDMGEAGAIIIGLIIAFFAAILIWWIVTKIIAAVRKHRARLKPKGALFAPPRPKGSPKIGVIRSAKGIATPSSGKSVAAYAIQYVASRFAGNAIMMREALTNGFEVLLDSGQLLRVAAGPVRIEDEMEAVENASYAEGHLAQAIEHAVRAPEGDQEFPLVPFEVAQTAAVHVGDRVAIFGTVEFIPDDRQANYDGGAFRTATAIMVTTGIPIIAPADRG